MLESSLTPFSHTPHAICKKTKQNPVNWIFKIFYNLTISQYLQHYNISPRCHYLSWIIATASQLVFLFLALPLPPWSILHTAVKVMLLKQKSAPITPLRKTQNWLPFSLRVKATWCPYYGLQSPAIFFFLRVELPFSSLPCSSLATGLTLFPEHTRLLPWYVPTSRLSPLLFPLPEILFPQIMPLHFLEAFAPVSLSQ